MRLKWNKGIVNKRECFDWTLQISVVRKYSRNGRDNEYVTSSLGFGLGIPIFFKI